MKRKEEPVFEDIGILDEFDQFYDEHLVLTDAQRWALVLAAASTHGLEAFPTIWRLLFIGDKPESGKTLGMTITAKLSANPESAKGTTYALQSALAAATNTPELDTPTLFYDEMDLFGPAGLGSPRHPFAEILREGYKRGATRQWSVNRSPQVYSIFTPVIMTALNVAVPPDVRSRCIIIRMFPGTPKEYFDVRESETRAGMLAKVMNIAVKSVLPELKAFRAESLRLPGLSNRRAEVWEPLFAVAVCLGGQKWLNRCAIAFRELALNSSSQHALTPRMTVLRDMNLVLDGVLAKEAERGFVPGDALRRELIGLADPLYANSSPDRVSRLIQQAMLPVQTVQLRGLARKGYPEDRMRGYYAEDIRLAWERVRPPEPEDTELPVTKDPFDASGEDDADFEQVFGNRPGTVQKPAGQETADSGGTGGTGGELLGQLTESVKMAQARRTRAKLPPAEQRFLAPPRDNTNGRKVGALK